MIQGARAEALGLIAHKAAAQPIAAMVAAQVNANALSGLNPDDMGYPKPPGVEAVRLGIYALVRLGSYDALASALVDAAGHPRSRWWPVAFAFQRINDPRAAGVLLELFNGDGQLTRAFAARGLGASKDQRAAAPLLAAAEDTGQPLAVRIQAVRAIALLNAPRAGEVMRRLITSPRVDQNLQLEAITRWRLIAIRRGGIADRPGVGAVAVGTVGGAQCRSRRPTSTRSSARSRRSIRTRTGRCARRWRRRSAICRASARRRR
jgi:HEAT repeat protein